MCVCADTLSPFSQHHLVCTAEDCSGLTLKRPLHWSSTETQQRVSLLDSPRARHLETRHAGCDKVSARWKRCDEMVCPIIVMICHNYFTYQVLSSWIYYGDTDGMSQVSYLSAATWDYRCGQSYGLVRVGNVSQKVRGHVRVLFINCSKDLSSL